jgi:undecaprenyl diphosphate synthase
MTPQTPRAELDRTRVPRHVAIIMDGNGRWAAARGLPRMAGHEAGEEALFDTVEGALELGLEWLTAYTFSTENWLRSADEVAFLMGFNEDLLLRRRDDLHQKGVRVYFIGTMDDPRVPVRNRERMAETEAMTEGNDKLHLVFAFNYGSRAELGGAARAIARASAEGNLDPEKVGPEHLAAHLYLPQMPDPDLIIRTSGELRLSNFLLWQAAYSELVFTPVLWPDFRREHLAACIAEYQGRGRRFGGLSSGPQEDG